MKRYTSLALIGVLVVGIAGFISLDAISATSFVTMKAASDIHETSQMIGHVTYELRGADGNIKHYVQSDNVIVDLGTDCAAQAIFDITGGNPTGGDTGIADVCTLGGNGGFAFIAIGNATVSTDGGTTGALAEEDDIFLDTSDGGAASFGAGGGDEMARSLIIIDADITPAVGSGLDTTVSIASGPFAFTDLGSNTVVTQSGLFDSAGFAAGNMFSIRDIPPVGTGLTVTNADTLSVTWTITLQ